MSSPLQQSDLSALVRHLPDYDGHEELVFTEDPASGLRALIAVHNTHRGPGVGGTRLWHYEDESAALTDVLRLSRGMTYKNAMAGLPFGGGKAVILAPDFSQVSRTKLMRAFGRMVSQLEGRYYTAEDVGTSCADMDEIRHETSSIFGLKDTSGDPSPHTARGVFLGIQACVERKLHTDSLQDVRVLVEGAGHVGLHLCRLLHAQGARLVVSDIRPSALARCKEEFGAETVSPTELYDFEAEVYAPCALGATLTTTTLDRLRVPIVAGAANNQLATEDIAEMVHQKGILYAPDYVINAGGIVNIACEMNGTYRREEAEQEVAKIKPRLNQIFELAEARETTTVTIANELAREQFKTGKPSNIRVLTLPDQLAPSAS
ncbi:MAG: Glu/Leu/Phe/Val family dehydrogenase [Verrucomicrobiales bacterium]